MGRADFLASIDDPRIRVVHSETNIGQNGYARRFAQTTAAYLDRARRRRHRRAASVGRDARDAFVRASEVGFLAADLEDDPHDEASQYRYRIRPHVYTLVEENGVGCSKVLPEVAAR